MSTTLRNGDTLYRVEQLKKSVRTTAFLNKLNAVFFICHVTDKCRTTEQSNLQDITVQILNISIEILLDQLQNLPFEHGTDADIFRSWLIDRVHQIVQQHSSADLHMEKPSIYKCMRQMTFAIDFCFCYQRHVTILTLIPWVVKSQLNNHKQYVRSSDWKVIFVFCPAFFEQIKTIWWQHPCPEVALLKHLNKTEKHLIVPCFTDFATPLSYKAYPHERTRLRKSLCNYMIISAS